MDSKNGMGGSLFSIYVNVGSTVTVGTNGSGIKELSGNIGSAFIPECISCGGRYLLTNNHVANVDKLKKVYEENIRGLINFPPGLKIQFTEKYRAVDANGATFLLTLIKRSDSIDAALFRFQKPSNPPRKSFPLQDEKEISFSPIGYFGAPYGIVNMLGIGNIARAKLHQCGSEEHKYLVFMAAINPGNSGGPLYNFETDKVNGMVTAYYQTLNGNNSMISCAVPASLLIKFLDETLPLRKKADMVGGG